MSSGGILLRKFTICSLLFAVWAGILKTKAEQGSGVFGGGFLLKEFYRRVFAGRRGPDAVCGVLFAVGLVLSAVAWFTQNQLLGWLVYVPWVLAVLRMFSTRLEQRYQENRRFLQWWQKMKAMVTGVFCAGRPHRNWADDGRSHVYEGTARQTGTAEEPAADTAYHHFVCPACGQKLRVPRGRGRVQVTCPKCKTVFEEMA